MNREAGYKLNPKYNPSVVLWVCFVLLGLNCLTEPICKLMSGILESEDSGWIKKDSAYIILSAI